MSTNLKGEPMDEQKTYSVASWYLETVREKIEKLNRKGQKLHCDPITMTVLGTKMVADPATVGVLGTLAKHYKFYEITISGLAPVLHGWRLLAKVEFLPNGNILKTVVEGVDLSKYHHTESMCEHCNTARYRVNTYVVQNVETLETKQVGSACVRDFIGHNSPDSVAGYYESLFCFMDEIDEYDDISEHNGARGSSVVDRDAFLSLTYAYVRKHGYVTRKAAEERLTSPTSGIVCKLYFNQKDRQEYLKDEGITWEQVMETGKDFVAEALKWISATPLTNDYLHNLKIILENDWVDERHMAIACSLIPAYQKVKGLEKASRKVSEYQGTVGERIKKTLTVKRVFVYDSYYGVTHTHIMEDADGNVYKWVSGSSLSEDETYTLKGTVRAHDDYKGIKQTILTRCKVQ
jgi:hypothetical protein